MSVRRESLRKVLAIVGPAVLVGALGGVTGGVWIAGALDTTPYGETEFNTAVRNARQTGTTQGHEVAQKAAIKLTSRLKESSQEALQRVEDKLAKSHKELVEQQRSAKKMEKELKERQERVARLESSLAEVTAILQNQEGAGATGGGPDTLTVEGTLTSTSVVRDPKPGPSVCDRARWSYRIRVNAGGDATVAMAELAEGDMREQAAGSEKKNKKKNAPVTVTCTMTYTAHLPTPLGSAYEFAAVKASRPGQSLDSQRVDGASLRSGSGPALAVKF